MRRLVDPASAQVNSPVCGITAVPPLVKVEGVAERMGDIALSCTGQPNQSIVGNLTVNLNTTITNRLLPNGKLDVALTANTGSGPSVARDRGTAGSKSGCLCRSYDPVRPKRLDGIARDQPARGCLAHGCSCRAFRRRSPSIRQPCSASMPRPWSSAYRNEASWRAAQLTGVASQIGSPLPEEITFQNLLARGHTILVHADHGRFPGRLCSSWRRTRTREHGFSSASATIPPTRVCSSLT